MYQGVLGLGLGLGLVELSIGLGLVELSIGLGGEPITPVHSHMLLVTLTQFKGHGEVDIYIIKYFSYVHMFFL